MAAQQFGKTAISSMRLGGPLCAVALGAGTLLLSEAAHAQDKRFEIGAYGGYLFGSSAEGEADETATEPALTSKASIAGAPSYGATIDVAVRKGAYAEFTYARSQTDLSLRLSDGSQYRYDLLIQYLQIGGLLEFKTPVDWLRPTFGGTIGATIFSADDAGFNYEEGYLSLIFEAGAKIRLTNFLGLRLRAKVLSNFVTDDSALFCVNGNCAYAYSGTALIQAELGAGAYLAF